MGTIVQMEMHVEIGVITPQFMNYKFKKKKFGSFF